MRRYLEEEASRLFLLDGRDIVDYGLEPFYVRDAVPTETDIVVLR